MKISKKATTIAVINQKGGTGKTTTCENLGVGLAINPKLKIEGILLTMTDSRTIYGQQISNLIRQAYGKHLKVFDQTIPRSVRAAETSTTGKSIFQYDPKGKVAEAYHSIAKGVLADAEKRIKRQSEQLR